MDYGCNKHTGRRITVLVQLLAKENHGPHVYGATLRHFAWKRGTRFEERRLVCGAEFLKLGEVASPTERKQSKWKRTRAPIGRGRRLWFCAPRSQAGTGEHYLPLRCSCWDDDASSSRDDDSRDSAESRSDPLASGRIRPGPTNAEARLGRCLRRTSRSKPTRMTQ